MSLIIWPIYPWSQEYFSSKPENHIFIFKDIYFLWQLLDAMHECLQRVLIAIRGSLEIPFSPCARLTHQFVESNSSIVTAVPKCAMFSSVFYISLCSWNENCCVGNLKFTSKENFILLCAKNNFHWKGNSNWKQFRKWMKATIQHTYLLTNKCTNNEKL